MRSRYSAYVLQLDDYVHRTWHASKRPSMSELQQDGAGKWLGLEVRAHTSDGDQASVEFVARYKLGGKAHRLHEVSRFVREQGQWYYLDGTFPERKKT